MGEHRRRGSGGRRARFPAERVEDVLDRASELGVGLGKAHGEPDRLEQLGRETAPLAGAGARGGVGTARGADRHGPLL